MSDADNVTPVSSVRAGQRARVVAVKGGLGRQTRLASMGVAAGVTVRVVHNVFRGPIILEVRGARLALGRGLAAAIEVRPIRASAEGT